MIVQKHGRRVLIPDCRRAYAALRNERNILAQELAAVKADRDRLLAALIDLQNAVRNRERAQDELNRLYRERAIARASATERNNTALH
jgi:hypothetical protein